MAEQEVIKHGKNLYKVWGEKNKSFLHKLKDFFVEIFIIVFAITLSLGLHNWSEHKNEQKQVKTFLTGLRDDLKADIAATKEVLIEYKTYDSVYTYLSTLSESREPNKDTLRRALSELNNNSFLRPHLTRFNGFLSSGKIMTIEDDSLVMNILDYYQQTIPTLQSSEGGWLGQYRQLQSFLLTNLQDFDNDLSAYKLLATSKGRHLTKSLIPWQQMLERYQNVITDAETIVAKIDKLYPKKD